MYYMVTIVNNTELHVKVPKKVDLKSPHHKKNKKEKICSYVQ